MFPIVLGITAELEIRIEVERQNVALGWNLMKVGNAGRRQERATPGGEKCALGAGGAVRGRSVARGP